MLLLALLAAPGSALAGTGSIDPSGRAALEVNFRYPPTHQQVAEAQSALRRMATLVCDATDGQVRIRRVRMSSAEADEGAAAFWFHPFVTRSGGSYLRDGRDIERFGSHMDVAGSAEQRPDYLAHLFAHHAFGLGDSYAWSASDEFAGSSACGFGPSFDEGELDELNHSIMQLAGGLFCDAGPDTNKPCVRDADCIGSTCSERLASEFSVASNHDRVRGEGGICPRPRALTRIKLKGILPETSEPVTAFDGTDFLTARATSSFRSEVDLVSEASPSASGKLYLYLTHRARLRWQLTAAVEKSGGGENTGRLQVLQSWTLNFNEDASLGAIEGGTLQLQRADGPDGDGFSVVLEVGAPNLAHELRPGTGFDGLQASKAGQVNVTVEHDGVAACGQPWCERAWNTRSEGWEAAEQTILHGGQSDWETLVANYPFLKAPVGSPQKEAPEVCNVSPVFIHDIVGAEQTLLVLDASQSMRASGNAQVREVCANGLDDDRDGGVDEEDCAESRIDGLKAAARIFAALTTATDAHLGVMAFSSDQEVLAEIAPLETGSLQRVTERLDELEPSADSAIGAALLRAEELFAAVQIQGRSRTGILVSDGANNLGVDPREIAQSYDKRQIRWMTLALGRAADAEFLSELAANSGGVALRADDVAELIPLMVELAARTRGESLLLSRTRFEVARALAGGSGRAEAPALRSFELDLEAGARELIVALSAADSRRGDWKLIYELSDPEGQRWDDTSAVVLHDPEWDLIRIPDPRPGRWRLRIYAAAPGVQVSNLTAFVRNPRIDFFADVHPRAASVAKPVVISARPVSVTGVEGPVRIAGEVTRPDGSRVAVVLGADPMTGAWFTNFDSFTGRGLYEVNLGVEVDEGAQALLGEAIFEGAATAPVRVPPFTRATTTSFYLQDGPWPSCPGNDCDGDGLSNAADDACADDVDEDGLPARWDADADNDELLDGREGSDDDDADGQPNFCDPRDAPTSLAPIIEDGRRAAELACSDQPGYSAAYLDQSLSNLRRLLRAIEAETGGRTPRGKELKTKLEQAQALKKNAFLLADVLPDFCGSYRSSIEQALAIETPLALKVSDLLAD